MGESRDRKVVFGPCLRELRKEKGVTLRGFCRRAGADPGNVSRIERGVWPPPQDPSILRRYAEALEVPEGSDAWYRLFDSAAADRGIVPQDLMSDEEVVTMLPVFFRTLRGQKPTQEEMRALVEKIRGS